MTAPRDSDGRPILPRQRLEAFHKIMSLRMTTSESGGLPYPEDWPLLCLVCRAPVEMLGESSGRGDHLVLIFDPCGHAVVADRRSPA